MISADFAKPNVHAEERWNDGRNRQNDCNAGEELHDIVKIVRNNRSISVRNTGKNAAVETGHIDGLMGFNDGIFE